MPLSFATWNVNSVRIREPHVVRYLARAAPDVLMLQEIKCEQPAFPAAAFAAVGYQSVVAGQKSYNGVAILSTSHSPGCRTTTPRPATWRSRSPA